MLPVSDAIYSLPILIVDDSRVNRSLLEITLRKRGFDHLLSVSSAKEALQRMTDFCPDIILLDVMMPEMDGFEYCQRVRSLPEFRDLPILFQTAITDPALRFKAFEIGATDFVSKPIYPDEVCARVMVHLQNRLYLKDLQEHRARIHTELENARQLQTSILPSAREIADIETRCGLDIASYFKPSSDIGGDFWGMHSLKPHQISVWLADVSGHGVASALNAFRLQAYMHEQATQASRPGEYLSMMNDKLLRLLQRGQFAAMFYGVIDTLNNTLHYACACHPSPILVRRANDDFTIIDGRGPPLGIALKHYTTHSIPFLPGDTLFLYSDALTETPDKEGHFMDAQLIADRIAAYKDATASVIMTKILQMFSSHSAGEALDDLTCCLIKRGLA